jgi:hypothetical protein
MVYRSLVMSAEQRPTARDYDVMRSQELEHKTGDETAEELGISRRTVLRTKRKQSYRDVIIAELEQKRVIPATFAENMKLAYEATRIRRNAEGEREAVPDFPTRLKALEKHGDILGVDAPKEFDLKHSMATMGDDELKNEIDASIEELDGRVKNKITGTSDARIVTEGPVLAEKPSVVVPAGEQAVRPTDA